MKIKREDYDLLRQAVFGTLKKYPGIREEYRKQGLSDMRFRWDLLWRSNLNFSSMYSYLNDDHIDTALRRIVKEI